MAKKYITIQGKRIGVGEPPFVIAEAGVNHNGRLDFALRLIDVAANAGADAVKFHTWKAEQVVTKAGVMASYQKRNTGKEESQLDMLRPLALPEIWYPKLIARAKERGIIIFSAPHGHIASVAVMEHWKFPAFKIASGDLTNLPLLAYAAKKGKPMLISTGMGTLAEVKEAVRTVRRAGNNDILVFQCTTDYPLAPEDANLRVIETFRKELRVLVGYSDHTDGDEAAIMAVTLGAVAVEKHLTLDRTMKGPDHVASMEHREFASMVQKVKRVPALLGSFLKRPCAKERQYMPIARKSIVASRDIAKGEELTLENLTIKRPGTGIAPKQLPKLMGEYATQNIGADTLISKHMFR